MKTNSELRRGQRRDLDLFVRKYFGEITSKILGIEHTRIYRTADTVPGLQPHAQLTLQHRIVNSAWKTFRSLSSRRLWLLVHFDSRTTYTKRESQIVGDSLARVVCEGVRNMSYEPDTIVWHELESWRYQSMGREFPKEVSRIDLQIVDGNPKLELWGPTEAYMVPHLPAEVVRERVSAKERHLKGYLSKCNEIWLLMVLDTGVSSNHFEVDEELLANRFSTSFSKLFLFRAFHSELFELETHPPGIICCI